MRKASIVLMLLFPLGLVLEVILAAMKVIPNEESFRALNLFVTLFGLPALLLGILLFFLSRKK